MTYVLLNPRSHSSRVMFVHTPKLDILKMCVLILFGDHLYLYRFIGKEVWA